MNENDQAYDRWKKKVEEELSKRPERKESFQTSSSIPVERAYFPEKIDNAYIKSLGFPGEYPYTRGIRSTMYRGKHWTMRQYAGFGSAKETNERFRYLLEQGQTGLSVAFDLPTQIGYDSDDTMALGEVGKVGVAIDTLEDMEILFDGISLDKVSTSMTINAPAAVLLAMYIAVAEKQGVPQDQIRGTIQNDILKEYIARGTYIFPPKPSMRIITDIFAYCSEHAPSFNTISISGYHIREAGSTAVQELAFTLSNAVAYVEAALEAGLDVDRFAPRLAFFFNGHNEFFEEVAKFRAARRMWAKIMKERFKAKNPKSWQLRFHTQVAGSTLTAQQPENNVVRVALQALAAVMGGTQSLHTNAKDEALSLPTEDSARIALRTQQIIAHETGVADTVDPLGGSYYVESLTDQLEEQAQKYMSQIDEMGGAVSAVEKQYMQREIRRAAYDSQKRLENEEDIVVGVNKFQVGEEQAPDLLKVDEAFVEAQKDRLKQIRSERDEDYVHSVLEKLKQTAQDNGNLMYPIIEAVKAYATVGEICHSLRDVFGEY
ncbi:methylmalonyl-CoA mutase family protein [Salipaludibacillus sp. CUR1]|uniref:acyl-CoA mutase large subunit family protein n=1 Tax=Salipaludibacillus sp. CUR1 TaxID=2820003 RepID=UPI001E575B14|nr:methylmalonyl-CoA mutase family protein [Salipaludibacillus sp. CUR1]MCE7794358.1 methylmalonyl-CoA mutase family protein [Salipaludibacillus sp. CUR1]